MMAKELKEVRERLGWSQARLAKAVGVASNSIARQERGELGISESVARLIRLIAAGVDVETIVDTKPSRRDSASKSAQGSKPKHPQSKSRGRTR